MHPTAKLILVIEKIITHEWGYISGVQVCGMTSIPENRFIMLLFHMATHKLSISDELFQELSAAFYEFLDCVDVDGCYTVPYGEVYTLGNTKQILIDILEGAKLGELVKRIAAAEAEAEASATQDQSISPSESVLSSSPIGGSQSE